MNGLPCQNEYLFPSHLMVHFRITTTSYFDILGGITSVIEWIERVTDVSCPAASLEQSTFLVASYPKSSRKEGEAQFQTFDADSFCTVNSIITI